MHFYAHASVERPQSVQLVRVTVSKPKLWLRDMGHFTPSVGIDAHVDTWKHQHQHQKSNGFWTNLKVSTLESTLMLGVNRPTVHDVTISNNPGCFQILDQNFRFSNASRK